MGGVEVTARAFEAAVTLLVRLRAELGGVDGPTAFLVGGALAALVAWLIGRTASLVLGVGLFCLLAGYEAGSRPAIEPAQAATRLERSAPAPGTQTARRP